MSAPVHCAGRSSLSLLAVWSEATMGATPCLLFVLIIGARILENTGKWPEKTRGECPGVFAGCFGVVSPPGRCSWRQKETRRVKLRWRRFCRLRNVHCLGGRGP
ncbi:hypothetical protein CesoFtcFv8_025110 [Champsocephalus esox]|uniref:Uncharacterized protein n=1 Tax=Champsocephalus esox TaxID=159716 RepID=A0AAN8B3Q1_9TELE|nr:hypothetical protein CesoFtcFv8_025110 [Champsocephalus esox]